MRIRTSTTLFITGAMLAACQNYPAPLTPSADSFSAPNVQAAVYGPQDKRVILWGRVQWSDLRRLTATSADVAQSATITMYGADGTAVVAGLANSAGDFTLYESTEPFTPTTGATYTLEVTRRAATNGSGTLLSLRTVLQHNHKGWTSITGSTIVVSALTTAMTQLEAADDSITPADVINTVNGNTIQAFGVHSIGDIQAQESAVVAKLAENLDPNQKISRIVGSVTITSAADLAMLKHTSRITGDLTIDYEGALAFDLPMLEEVDGKVIVAKIVEDSVPVRDLQGLASLNSIGALLQLKADSLTSLAGLDRLLALPGGLAISDVASLKSLAGLNGLATAAYVSLENLPALESISALNALSHVTNDIRLVNLGSTAMTSLGEFATLSSIGGELHIENVPALTTLNSFPALTTVGGLALMNLPALSSLTGLVDISFPQATTLAPTTIRIELLPLISNLAGLAGLTGRVHRLALDHCEALTSLSGIGKIVHLDEFYVESTGLPGFDSLPATTTSVGDLRVSNFGKAPNTNKINSLTGLTNVTIAKHFAIQGQPHIISLSGPTFASNLEGFVVDDCDGLTTLGFPNTKAISKLGLGLRVENNANLVSVNLTGLTSADANVKTIGTGPEQLFTFRQNPKLDICEVVSLISERLMGTTSITDFTADQVEACNAPAFSNTVTTLAGSGSPGYLNGLGVLAKFKQPAYLATDSGSSVYVSDSNFLVRKVAPDGEVSTFAGNIEGPGYIDGLGDQAYFNGPGGITVGPGGVVYVADNNRIRKITPEGLVTTLAGSGFWDYVDGAGTQAAFAAVTSIATNSDGTLYVTDSGNRRIRKITPEGVVSTIAGNGETALVDGPGNQASFFYPYDIAVGVNGDLYVSDCHPSGGIRKITPDGLVSTLNTNGISLGHIFGIDVDASGNVYVTQAYENRVLMVSPGGTVYLFAGDGNADSDNGPGHQASFDSPVGIAVGADGAIYVADQNNHAIRKITR